jgi:hypothetical protein
MGISVVIHGFIETSGVGRDERTQRVHRHNCEVIGALPEFDDEWPFITRSMFSIPVLGSSQDVALRVPQYESIVIAFGGSYKNMYLLEADWIRKFEHLLSRLCWDGACVYNDFSGISYTWDVDVKEMIKNRAQDIPCPPTKWSFKYKRLKTEDVAMSEAIDGKYVPVFADPNGSKE